jgi:two-component system chemotaxis sensor kinase CheA
VDELEIIKGTFFQECEELLADLENGLLAMEAGSGDSETVNAVFRAVHSIKGGAGAFGFEALVRFAHVFETLMDAVRSNKIPSTQSLAVDLLRAADILADHVNAAQTGDLVDEARSASMAAELAALTDPDGLGAGADDGEDFLDFTPQPISFSGGGDAGEPDFGFVPMAVALPDVAQDAAPVTAEGADDREWEIVFTPHPALYRNANEPALFLRELQRLGLLSVTLDDSRLPALDGLETEGAYLSWTARLITDASEATIREVFDFVESDCDLIVRPYTDDLHDLHDFSGEDDAEAPAMPDIAAILAKAAAEAPIPEMDGPPVVAAVSAAAPAAPVAAAPAAPKAAESNQGFAAQATIRVDPERIDKLIDLVGELVINQAMLAQRVVECGLAPSSSVSTGLDDLEQLTREIQESVMAIRAQPVKSVFQRMPRLVREVASMTGKQVRLVTDGEGTEVDKTVIERLSDPITHMIRNAIDHGLEAPDVRVAAGKPAEGVVKLAAMHRGGRIVIEVSDDGAGINRERVKAIALSRELIGPDSQLTDDEIDNLIFLPGFSTAAKVSDVSGRGVGMDVVRRSIQALGGRISITSRPGLGSTFTLSLPLTLAVLDGMVIDVAGQTLVCPLTAIVESLKPKAEEVRSLGPSGAVLAVRGGFVPLIDIGYVLGFRAAPLNAADGVVLLIENEDGGRAALVADGIQGQRQVVIKSLESNYRQVEGIAAATILGDGRVALILDPDAVVAMRRQRAADPALIAAE